MFKETVMNKTELLKIMEALDALGKQYTITKTMTVEPQEDFSERQGSVSHTKRNVEYYFKRPAWTIAEVEGNAEVQGSTVGSLTANVDVNISGLEEFIEKLRELINRPLSDFITLQIDTGDAGEN
ncbi:hypothetical protein [Paenibacillus sp. FSL R7-0331]|uniref:hypothetical protein n=1 Tax=Paenibacillus sp. FSL R7-0331 TaxID=1536773 RepID=UPI0004F5E268|nr:hypothetical protein [Paenibacillus sp. FSL R7-0331]AIQ54577.1 hypothetical protein R70331_25760 [Paenibacillus sp. FSL R7-0331]